MAYRALMFLAALTWAQPASAEMAKVNGIDLEYRVAGSGEPLLLLHGFGSCIDDSWGEMLPELAKTNRVIAVNMRGHGKSTNPANVFTHAQSAEDVRALLDQLGLGKVRAIGFSSGGMTLLHFATKYPARVSKLVVVGATTHFGDQTRRILGAVATAGLPPPVRQQFLTCASRGAAQADELTRQFTAFKDSRTDMNLQPADLAKITADTMIVHGDRDPFFPVAIPVAMYGSIPKSRLWIVPEGDHSPTAGAPAKTFLETVMGFLAR